MSSDVKVRTTYLTLVFSFFLLAVAIPAHAFRWTVTLPADGPYEKCRVYVYANCVGCDQMAEIKKGQTFQWSSDQPLTYVDGMCEGAIYLKSRLCDGRDVGILPGNLPACKKDIAVRICKKSDKSPYLNYEHGFCE